MADLNRSTQGPSKAERKKAEPGTDIPERGETKAETKILPPRPQTQPATQPADARSLSPATSTSPASQPSPTSQPATQPARPEPIAAELGKRLEREGLNAANRQNLVLQKQYVGKCQERVEELNQSCKTLANQYSRTNKLQADSASIDLNKSTGYLELSRQASTLAESSAELISANEKTLKALVRLLSFAEISDIDKKKVEEFKSELESHNKLLGRIKEIHSKAKPQGTEQSPPREPSPKPRSRPDIGIFGGGR